MKKIWLAVGMVLVLGLAPVMAVQQGLSELTPSLEIATADDLSSTSLQLEYGYFFADNHEGIASLDYQKIEIGRYEVTGGFFGLGYDYNFDTSSSHLPFVGGGLKFPMSDYADVYDMVLYARAGFKSFLVQDRVAVRSSINLEQYQGKGDVDNDMSIAIRVGLVIFFDAIAPRASKASRKR